MMGRGIIRNISWGTANTDTTITHRLGRIPVFYLLLRSKLGGITYDGSNGGTDWTTTKIVLRNTVGTENNWVWIL